MTKPDATGHKQGRLGVSVLAMQLGWSLAPLPVWQVKLAPRHEKTPPEILCVLGMFLEVSSHTKPQWKGERVWNHFRKDQVVKKTPLKFRKTNRPRARSAFYEQIEGSSDLYQKSLQPWKLTYLEPLKINRSSQKETSIQTIHFDVRTVSFQGCMSEPIFFGIQRVHHSKLQGLSFVVNEIYLTPTFTLRSSPEGCWNLHHRESNRWGPGSPPNCKETFQKTIPGSIFLRILPDTFKKTRHLHRNPT